METWPRTTRGRGRRVRRGPTGFSRWCAFVASADGVRATREPSAERAVVQRKGEPVREERVDHMQGGIRRVGGGERRRNASGYSRRTSRGRTFTRFEEPQRSAVRLAMLRVVSEATVYAIFTPWSLTIIGVQMEQCATFHHLPTTI